MNRLAPSLLAAALAACGSAAAPSTPVVNGAADRVCPPAEAVRIAQWQPAGSADTGVPDTPHWQVHLRDDLETYSEDGAQAAVWSEQLGARTEAEVRTRDPGPLGAEAWIYPPGAAAPCAAKVTGYYLAEMVQDGGRARTLAAQVEGCAPAEAESIQEAWSVLGASAPDRCVKSEPAELARRELESGDDGAPVALPADAALPPAVANVLPEGACQEPGCLRLWNVQRADAGAVAVYETTVTWLETKADEDACAWPAKDRHALLVGRGDEPAKPVDGVKGVSLSAVLHDDAGTVLLLTTASGVYGVHDLVGERASGRTTTWYAAHEEDSNWFSMAPYCGP